MAAATRGRTATRLPCGVLLVVLFTFSAWSLRVAFLGYDGLSDLTIAGVANEALRAVIFVGPALLYLRYAERAQATGFLWLAAPSRKALWILLIAGATFVAWYLLLDELMGSRGLAEVTFVTVLFTVLSPTTLIEEVYLRGSLLNKFWQTMRFWKANAAPARLGRPGHLRVRARLWVGDEEDRLAVARLPPARPKQIARDRGPRGLNEGETESDFSRYRRRWWEYCRT